MANSENQVDYTLKWRHYRIRSLSFWLFILLMMGFTLAQPALPMGCRRMFNSSAFFGVFGFVWLIGGQFLNLRLLTFRCPRCGQYFMREQSIGKVGMPKFPSYFTKCCVHCGLPKYARQAQAKSGMTE